MSLSVGRPAPEFELPADDGSTFRLSSRLGRRTLLVFYPGDDTSVCTAQLCEYRDGSQPALSQRLLRLEQRLGTPLFERIGRRLVANPAGIRMLRAARVSLHELRDAVSDVSAINTSISPGKSVMPSSTCPRLT